MMPSLSARRAWIEITTRTRMQTGCVSLSARRAWIEIALLEVIPLADPVALRKESVDRNQGVHYDNYNLHWSLSARRAWIEMIDYIIDYVNDASRSPQGERG